MFEDFYGLTGRPFQLTPDPNFYFESTTHRKALSYLGYGMAQGEGFIVITGEVGAGKSTLVAHLMQKIDHSQMTVGQIVTSNLDGEELVHVVAQAFDLDIEGHDKAGALGAIEAFLHEEARSGRRCMLVVDESQNLSVEALEELRMLSNFQLGSHPLLQTLLLGQPEFRQVLAEHPDLEQLRQRVIATHHLEPMGQDEIEPYIRHRLQCVGWDGNPEFDQRVFAELHQAAGGIPRKVNQIATRLLLLGAVEQRTRIDSAMLRAVLKEMQSDNAFPEAAPGPMPKLGPAPVSGPVKHAARADAVEEPQASPAEPLVDVIGMLAERDAQIAELQQAVIELSQAAERGREDENAALVERIDAFGRRLDEQERSVREVLAMLIEWIETGQPPRVAA
ncbi:XrtA/PEP-CTERM system-associated ATPase [Pelagerythrobacter marensis]|uniref:General secretion pathway protein-related protein n=1 Tax=Pelagerythrobacter marensis TaxID=543877 RepID=A0A0G3XAH8_9SPHN|nr:XrtA/PEP-CTERM system-associated ATPase [Pelagerythrobacter marensis]AKM07408.1 General secretion pathway protein-related protein [Pelagerythrobacter marensis]